MSVLGFDEDDKMSLFKTVAGIMHSGNIEVKQRPREEWASIPITTVAEKVAHLVGISSTDLVKALIKPRIKVGNEYVQRGCTEGQVCRGLAAPARIIQCYVSCSSVVSYLQVSLALCLSRSLSLSRLCMPLELSPRVCMSACSVGLWEESTRHWTPRWASHMPCCSQLLSLSSYQSRRTSFIGVLDIAGFEIFQVRLNVLG